MFGWEEISKHKKWGNFLEVPNFRVLLRILVLLNAWQHRKWKVVRWPFSAWISAETTSYGPACGRRQYCPFQFHPNGIDPDCTWHQDCKRQVLSLKPKQILRANVSSITQINEFWKMKLNIESTSWTILYLLVWDTLLKEGLRYCLWERQNSLDQIFSNEGWCGAGTLAAQTAKLF